MATTIKKDIYMTSLGEVAYFTICDDECGSVVLSALGAGVVALSVPDGNGEYRDVVSGYPSAEAYCHDDPNAGKFIGRYANRIGGAKFTLNGKEYVLPANEGKNQLHGGPRAYDKREWSAQVLSETSVRFTLISPDGDNGFPGELEASVTYTVEGGTLRLDFGGVCSADTVYAPTSHMYFNLGGDNVLDYSMQIPAAGWLEIDSGRIPTGRVMPPEGEFDFSVIRRIAREYGGLDALPEPLRDAALLRITKPAASLADLAQLTNPPVTKSCLSHRFRKIMSLVPDTEEE